MSCFLTLEPAVTVTGIVKVEMPAGVPEFPTAPVPLPPQEISTPDSNIHTSAASTVFALLSRAGPSLRHASTSKDAKRSSARIAVQTITRGPPWTIGLLDADVEGPDGGVVARALRDCLVVVTFT